MPRRRHWSGDDLRVLRDPLLAALGELGDPVLLDLALRVQTQLALDADLHPEALAVEAVLVAQVVAAERLVALEDVLERPAPAVVAPIGLLAVIGPSMKLKRGPPRFCSRSRSKMPSPPTRRGPPLEGEVVWVLCERLEHGLSILGRD
jgi:hypothetical protein